MINEEFLQLGNGWRVTNLSELVTGWQVIATDDVHVVIATGGDIAEAIALAATRSATGPFDKLVYSQPAEPPRVNLAAMLGLGQRNATPIRRRI